MILDGQTLSSNSERIPAFRPGVNRVSSGRQTSGCGRPGAPTFSIASADSSHTGSADSRRLAAEGVGPHSTHVCGALRARAMGCPREGVTKAGTGAARHDRLGESRVEKPRGDDSLADGSPRDRATGRSRARVETRPADLGRVSPETDPEQAGFPLWREAAPFTARRMSLVSLFARFNGYIEPILRRRKRAFVVVGIRTGRIVSLVEIEDPFAIGCLVGIWFEIEIPARTVGFLTTGRIPKRNPQSVVLWITLVRLERNGLAVDLESKLSPLKIVLLAVGARSHCYCRFALVLV